VLFLACVAGIALAAIRRGTAAEPTTARSALIAGFVGVASAAFLHGSLLIGDPGAAGVRIPRLVGLALLASSVVSDSRSVPSPPPADRSRRGSPPVVR
jgi:hypothetical protein